MQELLANPFILMFLISFGVIYFLLFFHTFNKNSKMSALLEFIYVVLLSLAISHVLVWSLPKFDPEVIYDRAKKLPSLVMQLGVYALCILFTYSRLRSSMKGLIYTISLIIKKDPFYFLLILEYTLSFMWATDLELALKGGIVLLLTTIFYIYVGKQYKLDQLFDLFFCIHAVMILGSLFYAVAKPSIGAIAGPWNGVFGHKNAFAFEMGLGATLAYIQSVRKPQQKFFFLMIALIAAASITKASSGMGRVLLLVMIALLIFIQFVKRFSPRWAFAAMAFFLAIGVSLTIVIVNNAEYIIVEKLGKDMTLTGRTLFWPLIVNEINREPVLGYGYHGFWQPWLGPDNPAAPIRVPKLGKFIPMHSHNGFLDLFSDLGWLGLSLYIISMVISVYQATQCLIRNNNPEAVLPIVVLVWSVLTNITETGLSNLTNYWIFYAMLKARLCLEGEKFDEQNQKPKPPPVNSLQTLQDMRSQWRD